MTSVFNTFLLCLLFGCSLIKQSNSIINYHNQQIDIAFIRYVSFYEQKCNTKLKSDIFFSSWMPTSETIGFCLPLFPSTIFIDKDWWTYHPESAKELLILHELGHCDQLKMHNFTKIYDPDTDQMIPQSIMYPVLLYQSYKRKRNYYLKEYCPI